MVRAVEFGPVELRPLEGLWVLRIGDIVGIPSVIGELPLAALGGGAGQLGFRMGAEELERRRRTPFLAHEKHCRVGRCQYQRGLDGELAVAQVLRRPVTERTVADLIVGAGVGHQPGSRRS